MAKRQYYDSLKQAAAAEGISLETFRRARDAGCPYIKGGRVVQVAQARKWIAEHEETLTAGDIGSLRDQKTREEIRKLRIKNDKDEGRLVLRTEVAAALRRSLGAVASICESKLVNEWPVAVAGLDVPQARVYGKRLHDSIMAECAKASKEFPE